MSLTCVASPQFLGAGHQAGPSVAAPARPDLSQSFLASCPQKCLKNTNKHISLFSLSGIRKASESTVISTVQQPEFKASVLLMYSTTAKGSVLDDKVFSVSDSLKFNDYKKLSESSYDQQAEMHVWSSWNGSFTKTK